MNMLDLAGTWWALVIVISTTIFGTGTGVRHLGNAACAEGREDTAQKDAATRENFNDDAVEERPIVKE